MRLIDANELIKKYKALVADEWNQKAAPSSWSYAFKEFVADLENEPTVDAVPVVRCKDCQWAEDALTCGCLYCNHPDGRNTIFALPEEFCDRGERRQEHETN